MAKMTVSKAHEILNKWYPNRTHHIGVDFWQHSRKDGTVQTTIEYTMSVHDPHIQVSSVPSLKECLRELRPKTPIAETDAELLDAADSAQEAAESLVVAQ